MKCLYGIGSILGILLLGGYIAATLRYNDPIEIYRWVCTLVYAGFFTFAFISELKEDGKI